MSSKGNLLLGGGGRFTVALSPIGDDSTALVVHYAIYTSITCAKFTFLQHIKGSVVSAGRCKPRGLACPRLWSCYFFNAFVGSCHHRCATYKYPKSLSPTFAGSPRWSRFSSMETFPI